MITKSINFLLIVLLFLSSQSCTTENTSRKVYDAVDILNKCISKHDPQNKWNSINYALHIQEPRPSNPARYSLVKINYPENSFELSRNRSKHISRHIIDKDGNSKVYLDDSENIPEALIEKFRLDPKRNEGYRNFYEMLYGLPMSLKGKTTSMHTPTISDYNKQVCYKIPIELKEALFSKNWNIYISKADYSYKGMEIYFPEDASKGERLYFEGELTIDGVTIPRIRHWYEFSNDEYSGSDIILKTILDD